MAGKPTHVGGSGDQLAFAPGGKTICVVTLQTTGIAGTPTIIPVSTSTAGKPISSPIRPGAPEAVLTP